MRRYQVYDLTLESSVDLPGLLPISTPSNSATPVKIVTSQLPGWFGQCLQNTETPPDFHTFSRQLEGEETEYTLRVWRVNQGQYFHFLYRDGTTFIIDKQGSQIWATWPNNLTLEDATTYLLGPILGFILRLRGTVCIHASAIGIKGQAVAFMGDAGAGKSTTVAAFAQKGYPILSDDVVALVDHGDRFLVQPAYPRIRLWSSTVEALYGDPDILPRIVPTHPTWDKRYLDLTQPGYQFQADSLPLAAVYYLKDRSNEPECPCIESIPVRDQLITLVANTYTNYLLNKQQRAQEFEILSRLVKQVPIREITPHCDVARISQLLKKIVEDFQPIESF